MNKLYVFGHEKPDTDSPEKRGNRSDGVLPHQARLQHIPQDVFAEARFERHLRSVRVSRDSRYCAGLL